MTFLVWCVLTADTSRYKRFTYRQGRNHAADAKCLRRRIRRRKIYDELKEFPPCPEILAPDPNLFSDYQKMLMMKNKIRMNTKHTKLVPNVMYKKNIVSITEF